MPGLSLWLVPSTTHPLYAILAKLISETLPAEFSDEKGPSFIPHLTLTSDISDSTYKEEGPQRWLDSIPWPVSHDIKVRFKTVKTQDVFVRRCYIQVDFDGVKNVSGIARARGVNDEKEVGEKTERWFEEWKTAFGPHVSLIYGNNPIDEATLEDITKVVRRAGVQLEGTNVEGNGGMSGWEGGSVYLVPTNLSIERWKPIAVRSL
ncbi:2',3'-cyclic-nucleotide 3'-phosphodiesterase [Xylariales sp. AK1849]|nr:2',3'-cyclic-nucleotide 3'-phosphodiesterase [Xylariales sp. AK1849]